MKKVFLFLLSLLVGIALFFWVLQTIGWEEVKNALNVFTGWKGIIILFMTFLVMLAGNWKWREILKGQGISIGFFELFKSYLAGFALMFLFPIVFWGGEFFRGYALKEKNSIPWSKGMASVAIDRILEWTTNLIIIVIGVFSFIFLIDFPPSQLVAIFGSAFALFAIGLSIFYFKCLRKESIIGFFLRGHKQPFDVEKEIFDFFDPKKKPIWKAFAISFLRAGLMHLRVWILVLFLGKNFGPLQSLSVLGFSYMAAMIPIPTSLGSHEAVQTFAFNSLGLSSGVAAAFTMIIRGTEMVFALIGVFMLFRLGAVIIKNILLSKISNISKT